MTIHPRIEWRRIHSTVESSQAMPSLAAGLSFARRDESRTLVECLARVYRGQRCHMKHTKDRVEDFLYERQRAEGFTSVVDGVVTSHEM